MLPAVKSITIISSLTFPVYARVYGFSVESGRHATAVFLFSPVFFFLSHNDMKIKMLRRSLYNTIGTVKKRMHNNYAPVVYDDVRVPTPPSIISPNLTAVNCLVLMVSRRLLVQRDVGDNFIRNSFVCRSESRAERRVFV